MLRAPAPACTTMPRTPTVSEQPPAKRWQWRDPDALHALAAAGFAMIASGGLLYLVYWVHAARVARVAPTAPSRARHLLVFGRQLVDGRPHGELDARVQRAQRLVDSDPSRTVWLLGGRTGPGPSEAEIALELLQQLGVPPAARIELEAASTHTLENLRHARELIARDGGGRVALISSRYHLARCAMLAQRLGFEHEVCAAEEHMAWHPAYLLALSREALLLLWLDVGARYARLIGHRRMLERVS